MSIDSSWLARYVTKTGIFFHPGIVAKIERERGLSHPEALLIYFLEDDRTELDRISNAWRQKAHRDRRTQELSALRNENPTAIRDMDDDDHMAYSVVMARLRQGDTHLLEDIISSVHLNGCPEGVTLQHRTEIALSVLITLRNAVTDAIDFQKGLMEELLRDGMED